MSEEQALQQIGAEMARAWSDPPEVAARRLVDRFTKEVPMQTVTERMIPLVSKMLGVPEEQVTLEAHLKQDLGADSLDSVELMMKVEEEFDLRISDDEAELILTVGDIIKFVESRPAKAA